VRLKNGVARPHVIDPSMFSGPVPVARWRDAMRPPRSSFMPRIELTRLGEAPRGANGRPMPGSGYVPGPDPKGGVDADARATMALYLTHQGTDWVPPRKAPAKSDGFLPPWRPAGREQDFVPPGPFDWKVPGPAGSGVPPFWVPKARPGVGPGGLLGGSPVTPPP
jgi:hypothetical protein